MGRTDDDDTSSLRIGGLSGPIEGATGLDQADAASALEGVDTTPGIDALGGASSIHGTAEIGSVDRTAGLAQALAAGSIEPAAAQAELVAWMVDQHLPVDAPPELRASLTQEVTSLLEGDPTLAALLRR